MNIAVPRRHEATPATPDRAPRPAPQLTVVPRRRRAAGFAVALSVMVATVMLGAAVLHTRLAERQLQIDGLERAVRSEQDRFDVLRRQRAELRSPVRLATEARGLDMGPAAGTEFVPVDPHDLARAIAATGRIPPSGPTAVGAGPLDQFRLVKSVANEAP